MVWLKIFWSPQTRLEISRGPLKKNTILLPPTCLELARLPVKIIQFWSPQTWLDISCGTLKTSGLVATKAPGDGLNSSEKYPILVTTNMAGKVPSSPNIHRCQAYKCRNADSNCGRTFCTNGSMVRVLCHIKLVSEVCRNINC